MNQVTISGILEERNVVQTKGGLLAKIKVATYEEFWSKKEQALKNSRTAFDVVAWEDKAQKVEHWLLGSIVEISGKGQYRVYEDKAGEKRWRFEIHAQYVKLLIGPVQESAPPVNETNSAVPDAPGS